MAIVIPATKAGFLLPKKTWDFEVKDNAQAGISIPDVTTDQVPFPSMSGFRAWAPYVLVAAFLLLTRLPALGLKPLLVSLRFGLTDILV